MNKIIRFTEVKKRIEQQKSVEYQTKTQCDALASVLNLLVPIINQLDIELILIDKNGEVDFLFEGECDD